MINHTEQEIALQYGAPMAGAWKPRFNSQHVTVHRNPDFMYEFGYRDGRCIYGIIQKTNGNHLEIIEAKGQMATNGAGVWKLDSPLDPTKDAALLPKLLNARENNLSYVYTSIAQDAFYPKPLFASHQLNRTQLVVFHPSCQMDLGQIAANPLV